MFFAATNSAGFSASQVAKTILGLLLSGGIGYLIGNRRGRGVAGFLLGFCLTWPGWIIARFLPPTHSYRQRSLQAAALRDDGYRNFADSMSAQPPTSEAMPFATHQEFRSATTDSERFLASDERPCPLCSSPIKIAAVFCRHCRNDVPAPTHPQ